MHLRTLLLLLVSFEAFAEEQLDVLSRDYSTDFGATRIVNSTELMRGQFRPINFTVLSAGMDGKLDKFGVRTGTLIKKGALIAEFDCDLEEYEHQIAAAKVEAASMKLEVNKRLDAYQNVSELELSMSEAELRIAQAEADRMSSVVAQCSIHSPFRATVTEKLVQAHQYVNKGEPMLEIVGTDNLEIEMVLPSLGVRDYEPGRQFTIVVDETGQRVVAQIDRVVNVVDPVSQTIRVIGRLVGSSEGLMPGMSGAVEFE